MVPARCYTLLVRYNGMPFAEGFQQARTAAERALAIDPELPQGHAALGWVQRTADWNWNGAEKSFRRALALAPQNAEIIGDAAVVVFNRGRIGEAMELGRRAVELDALNASAHLVLSVILRSEPGHYDEAERTIKKAIELAPQAAEYHASLSRLQAYDGHFADAAVNADLEPIESYRLYAQATLGFLRHDRTAGQAALDTLIARYSDRLAFYIARVYASARQNDQAFAWIERAEKQGDSGLAWVKTDVSMKLLRGDPRWAALLQRMNLADESPP
jgi:Tfp pilus assembly protein PilF